MTKAEMVHIIQTRYQEAHKEYKDACKPRTFREDLCARKLAHLNEVHYIANLLGIELPTPQAQELPRKRENG